MPAGLLTTVPRPVPVVRTVRTRWGTVARSKVAVTPCAAFIVTLQAPDPEQAPLHPRKVEPPATLGVRRTTLPSSNSAEQVSPQAMPPGELLTSPSPVPARPTERANFRVGGTAAAMVGAQGRV